MAEFLTLTHVKHTITNVVNVDQSNHLHLSTGNPRFEYRPHPQCSFRSLLDIWFYIVFEIFNFEDIIRTTITILSFNTNNVSVHCNRYLKQPFSPLWQPNFKTAQNSKCWLDDLKTFKGHNRQTYTCAFCFEMSENEREGK